MSKRSDDLRAKLCHETWQHIIGFYSMLFYSFIRTQNVINLNYDGSERPRYRVHFMPKSAGQLKREEPDSRSITSDESDFEIYVALKQPRQFKSKSSKSGLYILVLHELSRVNLHPWRWFIFPYRLCDYPVFIITMSTEVFWLASILILWLWMHAEHLVRRASSCLAT